MTTEIRDERLHSALLELALDHLHLAAPADVDGRPRRYIPCATCTAVVAVPVRVVSTICAHCARPCHHHDCGLMRYEHIGGACEPRAEDVTAKRREA